MAIVIGSSIFSGRNVNISGNRVIIDGVDVTSQLPDQKQYTIEVTGDIESIKVDACDKLTVNGNVGSVSTASGDIECGDVGGAVSSVSGDIDCGNIGGSVSTVSGDVKYRRI